MNECLCPRVKLTCSKLCHLLHAPDRAVTFEGVQVKRLRFLAQLGPQFVIRRSPSAGQRVVIPPAQMHQSCEGIVQAAVEADDELEVRVGVLVDLAVGGVEDLFDQSPLAREHRPRIPHAVAGDVVLLSAAQLHGDEVALEVVVQRRDQIAAVVVQVADPGGVRQVSVKELQLVALAALGGHAPPKPVVAVPHGVLSHAVEDAGQQAVGVVVEEVIRSLTEEAVVVDAVLQLAEVCDAVSLVVTQRSQPGITPHAYVILL